MKSLTALLVLTFFLTSCGSASNPTSEAVPPSEALSNAETSTPLPLLATFTSFPTETSTPLPTETPTPIPTVESLKATVTADKIVCRYGPGANYLYLIAFNKTTPVRLIGQAPGNKWVLVENGQQDCWVNSDLIALKEEGDITRLPSVYPDGFKLIVSPYYGPTTVLSAERKGNEVTVTWMEIIVSPGKYEDENMFPYLVEVWTCKDGEIVFDTLGSRFPFITITDEPGCAEPSHGRVYIQEKHGFAGPADIPWPQSNP